MIDRELSSLLAEFDKSPKSSRVAKELANYIVTHVDHRVLKTCFIELVGKIDSENRTIGYLTYSPEVSEALKSLVYMTVQTLRGEGGLDGEGLSNYISKAVSVGYSQEGIVSVVRKIVAQIGDN